MQKGDFVRDNKCLKYGIGEIVQMKNNLFGITNFVCVYYPIYGTTIIYKLNKRRLKLCNDKQLLSNKEQIKICKLILKLLNKEKLRLCYTKGLCYLFAYTLSNNRFGLGFNYSYHNIKKFIPLFIQTNAILHANASSCKTYWWDQKDFDSRIKFINWIIEELKK